MKKITALILALVLALGLTACDSGDSSAAAVVLGTTDELVSMSSLKQNTNDNDVGYQLDLPEAGEEIAVMTLNTGAVIKLRFFPDAAPKAVYNFKYHAIEGYYDGLTFHRVVENFMLQGGDPEATGSGGESVWGEPFEDEFNKNLLNLDGSVAMANSGANTNKSQFFINCTGSAQISWENYEQGYEIYKTSPDAFTASYGKWLKMDEVSDEVRALYDEHGGNPHLDGAYTTTGEGHTVFAQVFEGMEEIEMLSTTETDENDKPLTDIVIRSVEIVPYE